MAKYPEREGRQIELKQDLSGFDSLLKTIVAFLNDIGGLIAIGVVGQSREILGLTELQIEDYLERIPQAIADAIEPRAPVSI
jgi:predicted HTH transcriptional regulator